MANIFSKLSKAREIFHGHSMKKSGKNKFAGFHYFELSDFLDLALKACKEAEITSVFTEEDGYFVMRFYEHEGEGVAVFKSIKPESEAPKGMNAPQWAGALITYFRRYLWQMAFEIIELDVIDSQEQTVHNERNKTASKTAQQEKQVMTDTQVLDWLDKQGDNFFKHSKALAEKRPHLTETIETMKKIKESNNEL